MKNKIILVLLVLISAGLTDVLQAQIDGNPQYDQPRRVRFDFRGHDLWDVGGWAFDASDSTYYFDRGKLYAENGLGIKFYKRIWHTIDLDSIVYVFGVPADQLGSEILSEMKAGKLTAYADEKFTKPLTYKDVRKGLHRGTTSKYQVEEDLYYKKGTGKMVTQVVGIAPIKSNSGIVEDTHLFWLYFPQSRKLFSERHF